MVPLPVPRAGPVSTPTPGTHSVFLLRHRRRHRQPLPPNNQQQLAHQQPLQLQLLLQVRPPLQQLPAVPRPRRERHTRRHSPTTAPAIASDHPIVRPTRRPAASSLPQVSRQLSLRTCMVSGQAPELVQPVAPAGSWLARSTRVVTRCQMPAQALL